MKLITVRYGGECKKCSKPLEVGQPAMYERITGIFCVGCEPTETEEIRGYRVEHAERKAERYDEWAGKREVRAEAQLNSYPEIRHDIAFCTQPGHIPFRARMNASDDRACESLQVAERMRDKADSLRRGVRVKGDVARKDQAIRDYLKPLLKPGMRIRDGIFSMGTVVKVNQKSATVKFDSGGTYARDLIYLRLVSAELN